MGAVLYLSLILLVFCLSQAARSQLRRDAAILAPDAVPDSVRRAARRAAQGISIARVRVRMNGANNLRYQVSGIMPDGRAVELDIYGDGAVYRRDLSPTAPPLPAAVSRRLRRSLPTFRPRLGAVRLINGASAVWYEIDGLDARDKPVRLRISPDGKAFHLMASDRPI